MNPERSKKVSRCCHADVREEWFWHERTYFCQHCGGSCFVEVRLMTEHDEVRNAKSDSAPLAHK